MKEIDARQLRDAFLLGATRLNQNKEYINELNVFPVPDGDTGTNMTMTILSAARAVADVPEITLDNVLKAMARGSLRGARGNSGVILSQLIRGFTKEIQENEHLDTVVLAAGFRRAVDTAYKAVMKPKEGTILTVAKAMADKIEEQAVYTEDIETLLAAVVEEGDATLLRTPEMLPVLKEAGVVDSGGQGLMTMIHGALDGLRGEMYDPKFLELSGVFQEGAGEMSGGEVPRRGEISTSEIKFGYCTEFMVHGDHSFTEEEVGQLREWLSGVGDSIVCFSDEEMIKVHVHTNHPGNAFEKGLSLGYLSRMKVDNMRLEHHEVLIKDASRIAGMQREEAEAEKRKQKKSEEISVPKEHKEFGFVSVCAGEGLKKIFEGLGVDTVISGGQTMNPSTEDILKAVEALDADHIYILPNNRNIILAANQAKALLEKRDIHVIPTSTIPQGVTAMISFNPDRSAAENAKAMEEMLSSVFSAEVTYAVRDTTIEGKEIRKGDVMCLSDRGLLAVEKDSAAAVEKGLSEMLTENSEIVTLYYGEDVKAEEAEALTKALQEKFPKQEFELQYGGQPVYYYMISVE